MGCETMLEFTAIINDLRKRIHEQEKAEIMKDNILIPRFRAKSIVSSYYFNSHMKNYTLRLMVKEFERQLNLPNPKKEYDTS
jgi:hypothetical protein